MHCKNPSFASIPQFCEFVDFETFWDDHLSGKYRFGYFFWPISTQEVSRKKLGSSASACRVSGSSGAAKVSLGSKLGELQLSRDSSWQPVEARRRANVAIVAVLMVYQMPKHLPDTPVLDSLFRCSSQKAPEREMSCIVTCAKNIQFN